MKHPEVPETQHSLPVSIGRRNTLGEHFTRLHPAKRLTRVPVELASAGVEICLDKRRELKNREELLYNGYQSGRDVIRKYRTRAPHAYLVPPQQRDPVAPSEFLKRLAFMGIRISQTDRAVAFAGATYPKGTWVIPMDQEFAEFVKELFDVQPQAPSWSTPTAFCSRRS